MKTTLRRITANSLFLVLGVALIGVRVPFFYTDHVQEDAYISWRCAVNLVDTGIYGFNRGTKVSASSSHAGVAVAGLFYRIAGARFITVLLLFYSLLTVASCAILAFA